jgi:hypothetical protein
MIQIIRFSGGSQFGLSFRARWNCPRSGNSAKSRNLLLLFFALLVRVVLILAERTEPWETYFGFKADANKRTRKARLQVLKLTRNKPTGKGTTSVVP